MSDPTTPATPAAPVAEQPKPAAPAAPETPAQRDADEPLGQPGLKALQAERDRVTALENELKGFKPLKDQMDALRGIFGDKTADPGKDIVTTLQDQVAEMRHDTLVERVARSHGISDDKDVAVLRAIKDESLMQQLAERLKASNNTPPTPAHDPSQGSAPISEAAAADAAYQAFFPSSSK
jgi:hypothetical protein